MTSPQITPGPWVIRPDAQLPFDLRISSAAGAHIAKVYGEDGGPREQLATALAAVPQMIEALRFYAKNWTVNGDGDASTPGLSRTWMEPTDDLTNDEGAKAMNALMAAGIVKEPELPGDCPGHVARDDDPTRCRYCGASSFDEAPQPEDGP